VDEQNLSIGARDLGYELQHDLLANRLGTAARSAELHLFTAADLDTEVESRFKNMPYIVHTKAIRRTRLDDGRYRSDCNIDNLFSFWVGVLAVKTTFNVIVFGSGDYGLAGELSKEIRSLRRKRSVQIMTLSLPGSTAQDLDSDENPDITANLEIGLDLLKPIAASFRRVTGARGAGCHRSKPFFSSNPIS
jgi:hypothetical protein